MQLRLFFNLTYFLVNWQMNRLMIMIHLCRHHKQYATLALLLLFLVMKMAGWSAVLPVVIDDDYNYSIQFSHPYLNNTIQ